METAKDKIRVYPSSRKELRKRAGAQDTTIAGVVNLLLKSPTLKK